MNLKQLTGPRCNDSMSYLYCVQKISFDPEYSSSKRSMLKQREWPYQLMFDIRAAYVLIK